MKRLPLKNIIRIIVAGLLQVLVFKQIQLGGADFNYFHLLVYPVVIMLLPINLPSVIVLLVSFVTGLGVDAFYDTPGLHAGALVMMGFSRPAVLRFLAPDSGYTKTMHPVANNFGLLWYIQYTSILLFIFLLTYFSLEAFTPVYISSILIKTFLSFIASFVIILLHQIIMNPKS